MAKKAGTRQSKPGSESGGARAAKTRAQPAKKAPAGKSPVKKTAAKKAPRPAKKKAATASGWQPADRQHPRLYTLEVFLIGGMITEKFAKQNPVVSRTIQIRGDQTLEDLHYAIFDAFERFDEHMYEFQFGTRPMDPKGPRYVLPLALEDYGMTDDLSFAGTVDETTLDALQLKVRRSFGYWFDFGDDWWHQIDVAAIDDTVPKGKFPKVVKRVGKSPPQYPEL